MKRQVFLLIALLTILLISAAVKANDEEETQDIGEFSSKFVMEIAKTNVDLFAGSMTDGSSGSGFIYKIRVDPATNEKYAIIFTNLHVVTPLPFNKRTLTLSFSGPENTKEQAKAELLYESNLDDFSAIKVQLKDLPKSIRERLVEGKFPSKDSPFYNFRANHVALRGTGAIALGNPLGGSNITTFGPITGLNEDPEDGDMIQTQAPINEGNSGGPLITEDGLIIGINTSKEKNADNTGYAIPIARVLEEFEAWEKDRTLAHNKTILVVSHTISTVTLDIHGSKQLIDAEAPGYFKRNRGALVVQSAHASTKLQTGDQIFRVNGEEVGTSTYSLKKSVFYSKKFITVELIRENKKVVKVKVPIVNTQFRELRETLDIVSLSGMLFVEKAEASSYFSFGEYKKRVWLVDKISSSQTNLVSRSFPSDLSVLKAVRVDGQTFEIESLKDLKTVLKKLPKGLEHVDLIVYQPTSLTIEDQKVLVNNVSGSIQHNPHPQIFPVPVTEILMYPVLDMKGFEEQFSSERRDFKTRDFQGYTNKRRLQCEAKLKPSIKIKRKKS